MDVVPSVRLAGEGSGGFDDPTPDRGLRFRFKYDLTLWLEGDKDVLYKLTKVAYALPTRLQATPVVVTSKASRFCQRLSGTVTLDMGENLEASVVAIMTFTDGNTLSLSPHDGQLPVGQRPSGCP